MTKNRAAMHSLSIAVKTNHRPSNHNFKVGDLVLVKKHNKTKLQSKWNPGYGIIKLPTPKTVLVENQLTGISKAAMSLISK